MVSFTDDEDVIDYWAGQYGLPPWTADASTSISSGLLVAQTMLLADPKVEDRQRKTIVLLSDGDQSDAFGGNAAALVTADEVKASGVAIYAVGIGDGANEEVIKQLASSESMSHTALTIPPIISFLEQTICDFFPPAAPPSQVGGAHQNAAAQQSRTSEASATTQGDPHIKFAHGGRADWRGTNGTLWHMLSARNLSIVARTVEALFMLQKVRVNGSFFDEYHIVSRTSAGRWLNVSHLANELNERGYSYRGVRGACDDRPFKLGPHQSVTCDELVVRVAYSSLHLRTREWQVTIRPKPVYDRLTGPRFRLDLTLDALVDRFEASPHGLIGQSFVQNQRQGRVDEYPALDKAGNFTTSAMAEGAIDGAPSDYEAKNAFDVDFRFGRFHGYLGARRLGANATVVNPSPL